MKTLALCCALALTLCSASFAQDGTKDGLFMQTSTGFGAYTSGPGNVTKTVLPGDIFSARVFSVDNNIIGRNFSLWATIHSGGGVGLVFPGLYANIGNPNGVFNTTRIWGNGNVPLLGLPAVLGPNGFELHLQWPIQLVGFILTYQGIVPSPSAPNAIFHSTDLHHFNGMPMIY